MNLFGVFVIIGSLAIGHCHPFEQNVRFARAAPSAALRESMQRYRLKNFPSQYQAHVIDYPGSAGFSGQQQATIPQAPIPQAPIQQAPIAQAPIAQTPAEQINYQQYQQIQEAQPIQLPQPIQTARPIQKYHHPAPAFKAAKPVHIAPVTTTTTTTTPLPIYVDEAEAEEEYEEIPAPAPVPVAIPASAVRKPHRRVHVQPQQKSHYQSTASQRFQLKGQDFADVLPEEEYEAAPIVSKYEETEEERLLREEQARSAHYSFGTSIDDRINDHSIHRQETRDGLALKGMYSYSDGYFQRTIHYEADENGYRVVKEQIEPIGDGPQFDPNGTADISANLHNNNLNYSITADDFVRERPNKTAIATGRQSFDY